MAADTVFRCQSPAVHQIGVRVRLDTLSREQTAAYIDYRLRIAVSSVR